MAIAEGSTSRARDILSRQAELESERSQYEAVWEAVSEFCDPDAPDVWSGRRSGGPDSQAERQERRGSRVYANTINSAANRLAAGLESLIIPQSEKWHGLSTAAMNDEETDEEKEWAEALRDFLFALRYSANSNFVPATQACLRNVVRYGPAYLYAEEGFGGTLIRYASIPVAEGYLSRNRWGQVDTFHRRYERTARQAAQLLGYEKLPARIKVLVDDPAKCETKISLIQCIKPRDERKMYRLGGSYQYLDTAFASYHVIEDEEEIVRESGFRSFPVSCFNWRRYEGDPYRKLTLAYVSGSGTLPTTADGIWLMFARAGDKGADGTGAGDFTGPASSVMDNIVTFNGATGKVGKDSGIKASDLIAGPASAVADNIATFNGTTGKLAKDSGVAVSSLAPKASPTFTGTPAAPTQAPGDNSTKLATTAYVDTTFAPKVGPTITTPTLTLKQSAAPTPTAEGDIQWDTDDNILLIGDGAAAQTFVPFPASVVAGDLFYASSAKALVRLPKGTAGQALLMNTGATAPQWSTLPFTLSFESAPQTITTAGTLTIAHGLGVKPKLYVMFIQCITAELGYSIGDELATLYFSHDSALSRGASIVPDATNFVIRFGSQSPVFAVLNKATGSCVSITIGNWKFLVRAWA